MKRFIKINLILAFTLVFFTAIFSGCKSENKALEKTEFMLGTVCSIKVYDGKTEKALDESFKRIKDIEDKMSVKKENTELDAIADAAGKKYVKVSDDTFYVLQKGKHYSEQSEGVFDITVGPLVQLWGIGTDKAKVPSDNEINDKKSLISYKDLLLDEKEKKVMLKRNGMSLDLGGIAKGYAADEVNRILKENGVKHAIINLGGNIIALNDNPKGKPWTIGIQNPFEPRGDGIASLQITNKAVVTSGIYERYVEKDGKKYHHILSPFTGYPMDNSLASVTLVMDTSVDADAMTKNIFYKDAEKGMEYVKGISGVDAIFVTKDKKVYMTDGIKDKFELINTDFQVADKNK